MQLCLMLQAAVLDCSEPLKLLISLGYTLLPNDIGISIAVERKFDCFDENNPGNVVSPKRWKYAERNHNDVSD